MKEKKRIDTESLVRLIENTKREKVLKFIVLLKFFKL